MSNFSPMSLFSNKKNSTDHTILENIEDLKEEHPLAEIVRFSIIAILIVIPIRLFVAQPFIVSGASMDETFHSGEYLIVDQVSYYFDEPTRGDVIVFRYPRNPSQFFIKRIIGIPGDTINIEDAQVTITNEENPDGFTIDEPYVNDMSISPPTTEKLGEREYFVMGDNRDNSSDSREWGVLQEDRIIGRALVRLFPPSQTSYLPGAVKITNTGTSL